MFLNVTICIISPFYMRASFIVFIFIAACSFIGYRKASKSFACAKNSLRLFISNSSNEISLSRALSFTNPLSHFCRFSLRPPFGLVIPKNPQNSATPPQKYRFAADVAYFREHSCIRNEVVVLDIKLRIQNIYMYNSSCGFPIYKKNYVHICIKIFYLTCTYYTRVYKLFQSLFRFSRLQVLGKFRLNHILHLIKSLIKGS